MMYVWKSQSVKISSVHHVGYKDQAQVIGLKQVSLPIELFHCPRLHSLYIVLHP